MPRTMIVAVALLACACGSSPPAPSPAGQLPAPPPALPPEAWVTGRVTEPDGRPVPEAEITAVDAWENHLGRAVSDAGGTYSLPIAIRPQGQIRLQVEAEGHEAAVHLAALQGSSRAQQDLRLHRIVQVDAGESLELTLGERDPVCRYALDDWPCRRIRVVSGHPGNLSVSLVDAALEPSIRLRSGSGVQGSSLWLQVNGDGGATLVDVLLLSRRRTLTVGLETELVTDWWASPATARGR